MRLDSEARARGLDPDRLAERFGLVAVQGNGGDYLAIPFYEDGKLRNRKYRTTLIPGQGGGKQWQDGREKGAKRVLYNIDALKRADLRGQPVIITEGEPDLWALDLAGFERVIGWPDGAPSEPIPLDAESPKYQPLEDAMVLFGADNLGGADVPIIIAADGDEAGAVLLHDLSLRLGRARCKFLQYPRRKANPDVRCKDLGEVLEDYGTAGVVETINRAKWIAVDGVYRLSELPPAPVPKVFSIDMPLLGDSYRMRLGDWTVVTGIPSHGKSTFVNDVICRVVEKHSVPGAPVVVAFASFEQHPRNDHRRALGSWYLGKDYRSFSSADWTEVDLWLDAHFRFMVPNEDDDVTLDWCLEKMALAVIRDGVRIVVVDPWNEMDHLREPGESMTEYVGRAIKAFRRFARKFEVHLIIVAHPTKLAQDKNGEFPVPTLYHISDSANWYNKCDVGIVVHRNGSGATMVWVQKSRYHDEIGKPGRFEALYHAGTRRFDIVGHWHQD
jgi:twinkle protein